MREKRELNVPAIMLFMFSLVAFGLVASFIYLSLNGLDYTEEYQAETAEIKESALVGNETEFEIVNEANLSDSQEEIVRQMAILLKLYNLHEIPYTRTTPKIQVFIDENPYFVEIKKGEIIIKKGETFEKDIEIRTTSEEIIKMKQDEEYIKESMVFGKTTVKRVASDFVLFSKGYFELYQQVDFGI
ncbi:MAG: hypothetical protein PHQ66_00970 [Candidatus Nanoarchaeia archaeon]|nr:hypothetical protein [Candidatus Nanoarchaeia archaeon]MDD5358047.1 hypothetical protein [Candidatus Nanoarchaeia archaeon]MDD5588966.1 hypothetical protein [Candidatus Nanoarchaeia archaeon]